MDVCDLRFFSWVAGIAEDGNVVVTPACPIHPEAPVSVEELSANEYVVTCSIEPLHHLNTCTKAQFERERDEARKILVRKQSR